MKTLSTTIQSIATLHVIEFCALIQKLSKKKMSVYTARIIIYFSKELNGSSGNK